VSRIFDVDVPRKIVAEDGLDVPGYGLIPAFLHHRTERGLVSYAPFPDGRRMISVSTRDIPEPDAPYTFDEFREALKYVLGVDVPVTEPADVRQKRRLSGGNTRLAAKYRSGRILLVGDAAHVHSAIGGPGLNLGLQDAVNLGWKLAATINGNDLLDTYESERRPVAERVVMQTQAQSALIGPGADVTALRVLFGELLEQPGVRQTIAGLISGADVRYDMGIDAKHPLIGRFAPDLGPATRAGRPILNDPTGRLAKITESKGNIEIVKNGKFPPMLVRPDGYVAWAGEDRKLQDALNRWFR
jgi:hypothetical protein